MQRLRELSDLGDVTEADKPTIAELQRLAHAVRDIEPAPGAQARVLAALRDRRSSRPSWQPPMLAAVVLVSAAIGMVVSTRWPPLVPRQEPVTSVGSAAIASERPVTSPPSTRRCRPRQLHQKPCGTPAGR